MIDAVLTIVGGAAFLGLIWLWHVITYPDFLKPGDRWWWIP